MCMHIGEGREQLLKSILLIDAKNLQTNLKCIFTIEINLELSIYSILFEFIVGSTGYTLYHLCLNIYCTMLSYP